MLLPILFLCMKGTAHTRTLVLLPVLCPLLPTYLVSGEHQEQRRANCPLHIQAPVFPYTLLWLPLSKQLSSSVSVPLLLPLDWRKDDPKPLISSVVAGLVDLPDNQKEVVPSCKALLLPAASLLLFWTWSTDET